MSQLDKLVTKFYSLFEKGSEWQHLKSLLDEINVFIVYQNSFTLQQILVLSKLVYLSLSPNVSQVHPIVYRTLDLLSSKNKEPKFISLLSYSLFSHCKRVDKATMDSFLETIISFLGIIANNQTLTCGFLAALLSDIESNPKFAEIASSIIERHPVVAEELVWAKTIHAKSHIKGVFKLLGSIKDYNSCIDIILKGFISGLNSKNSNCRNAAVDSICSFFSLKNQEFHNVKVFIFSCLLSRIHDQRIFLRVSKFITDSSQEYLEVVIIQAVNYLLSKNILFDIEIILKLQDPENDYKFVSDVFYEQTITKLIINIGKFQEKASEEYLKNFKLLFEKKGFEQFACTLLADFDSVLNGEEYEEYFKGLVYLKKNLLFNKNASNEILNMLVDSVPNFSTNAGYFLCCSYYIDKIFPVNISQFLANCNEQLENMSIGCLENFSELYLKIIKINKNMKIESFSIQNRKFTRKIINFLKIIVCNMDIALTYQTLKLLWDNYTGEFHEDIKVILLYSGKAKRDWIKIALKNLKTKKGVLAIYNFFYYCFLQQSTILCRQEIVYNFYLGLYKVIEKDYSLQPYLSQLWVLITSEVSVFFEPIFKELIRVQVESTILTNSAHIMRIFEAVQFALNIKNIESLRLYQISDEFNQQYNVSEWFNTSIISYSDLFFSIFFKYLTNNQNNKDLSISAFNVLYTFAKQARYQQALKLIDLSYECLNSRELKISAKILVLKILSSLNFHQIYTQQKSLTTNILRNSALNSLPTIIRNELENSEKNPKFEKFLGILIQLYFNISELYFCDDLISLVPTEFVKLKFFNMSLFPDNENSYALLEFLWKLDKKKPHNWVINVFLEESPNIFDLLDVSETCNSSFLQNFLSKVLKHPVVNNIEFSKGVVKLWAVRKVSKSDSNNLETIIKYLPFFDISLDTILFSLDYQISTTTNHISHLNYLDFLLKFTRTYQTELELSKNSPALILNILKKVKLQHCFLTLTESIYLIIKAQESPGVLRETCKILKDHYKNFFTEFFNKGLTSCIKNLDEHNIQYSAICEWLKISGLNFCQLIWDDINERNLLIGSWCKNVSKNFDVKFPVKEAFLVFSSWSKNSVLYNQFIRPPLMDIVSNNEKILRIFSKNPQACFGWCEVLNQCSAHTKFFIEFRTAFIPKGKNIVYAQETVRILYVTALMIYSADIDDYLHPSIYEQIKQELNEIIYIDNFFPIAALMLMVLSVRLSFDQFLQVIQKFWPIILSKFYENQNRVDLIVFCSLLKLLDILVALDYYAISQIHLFYRNPTISEKGFKKQLVVKIPESFNSNTLRQEQEKLILHFNTSYSQEGELDVNVVSSLIENEFYRCKDLV